jgi:hypothetical protein
VSLQQLSLWNPDARRVVTAAAITKSETIPSFGSSISLSIDLTYVTTDQNGRAVIASYTTAKKAIYFIRVLAVRPSSFNGVEIYVDGVLKASASATLRLSYTYSASATYSAILKDDQQIQTKIYAGANQTFGCEWLDTIIFIAP